MPSVGVHAVLNEVHGVQQLAESLERVVLALQRNQQRIGCREHVERDESERGRAVDEDEVVVVANGVDRAPHAMLALRRVDELHLRAREIGSGREHVEVAELDLANAGASNVRFAEQDVVGRALEADPRSTPTPLVALPCGSPSMSSVRRSATARLAARLTAVVVLPTPPFWFAIAMTRATDAYRSESARDH